MISAQFIDDCTPDNSVRPTTSRSSPTSCLVLMVLLTVCLITGWRAYRELPFMAAEQTIAADLARDQATLATRTPALLPATVSGMARFTSCWSDAYAQSRRWSSPRRVESWSDAQQLLVEPCTAQAMSVAASMAQGPQRDLVASDVQRRINAKRPSMARRWNEVMDPSTRG